MTLIELIAQARWWEPVLITAAVLAMIYEKNLIIFEKRAIVRLCEKHERKERVR